MTNKRHKENPFVTLNAIETTKKRIRVSHLGKDNNIQLFNGETGEIGGTHVCTYKQVDSGQFVKLFTQNIGLIFDLSKAGIKSFTVLMDVLQEKGMAKDRIHLDTYAHGDFIEKGTDLIFSYATFTRGLVDLEKSKVIAKTTRRGEYFINPNFCFNGDRVAFTTMIERKG